MKINIDNICAVMSAVFFLTIIVGFSLLFVICFLAGIYLVVRMILGW
jgi:hypothetical protein